MASPYTAYRFFAGKRSYNIFRKPLPHSAAGRSEDKAPAGRTAWSWFQFCFFSPSAAPHPAQAA